MKKIILFLVGVVCLSSCKKIYTCECNTTSTLKLKSGNFFTEVTPGNKTPYSEKLTKKQATAACDHEAVATETNFKNAITGNNSYPLQPGESISTTCILH